MHAASLPDGLAVDVDDSDHVPSRTAEQACGNRITSVDSVSLPVRRPPASLPRSASLESPYMEPISMKLPAKLTTVDCYLTLLETTNEYISSATKLFPPAPDTQGAERGVYDSLLPANAAGMAAGTTHGQLPLLVEPRELIEANTWGITKTAPLINGEDNLSTKDAQLHATKLRSGPPRNNSLNQCDESHTVTGGVVASPALRHEDAQRSAQVLSPAKSCDNRSVAQHRPAKQVHHSPLKEGRKLPPRGISDITVPGKQNDQNPSATCQKASGSQPTTATTLTATKQKISTEDGDPNDLEYENVWENLDSDDLYI